MVKKTLFANFNGEKIFSFTLSNGELCAEILNYGGIIRKLIYKGIDVVLGRDSMQEYTHNNMYFGAIIGRNANRIEKSQFELNGTTYILNSNNGKNNLHGGFTGFDKKIWNAEIVDGDESLLILSTTSKDGEEGFPGNIAVQVTYSLTKDNCLRIHYQGKSDSDTILNMTNHSYFNLNGHSSGNIDAHLLWVDSDFYTPNTNGGLPNGEILSVKGTPFDFSTEDNLGKRFLSDNEQIKMFGGFDHNLVLNGRGYRKVAHLIGNESGITMSVYTDAPGLQLYTVNNIDEKRICKEGAFYCKHSAVCLETQVFPNNLKFSHFPSSILKKGETYDTITSFQFV